MTLMALAIALALIVVAAALVLRGVQQRMLDERQSVEGYQRALDTLRHVSEQRSNPLVVLPQSEAAPEMPRPDPVSHQPAHFEPVHHERRLLATTVATERLGAPAPEAAQVVHELVAGRALFGEQSTRRPLTTRHRRAPLGGGVSAIAAVAVIVTVTAVAYALLPGSSSPSSTRTSHHVTTPVSKAAGGTSNIAATLAPTTSTTYTATYKLPSTDTQLLLSATGSCWVYATDAATGAVLWTGTLLAGQTHILSVAGTVRVRLGAAGSVNMSVGQTPVVLPSGYRSPFNAIFQVA